MSDTQTMYYATAIGNNSSSWTIGDWSFQIPRPNNSDYTVTWIDEASDYKTREWDGEENDL